MTNLSVFNTSLDPDHDPVDAGDALWLLRCTFMVLTMQTGFTMLEAGFVSERNSANIMMKNFCDVVIGCLAYWMFGHALSFGHPASAFCGYGEFFYQIESDQLHSGVKYTKYFFQLSFSATATTIVSGAIAERMRFHAYMVLSFFNTFVYCISAFWCRHKYGFLRALGFYDFAGVCVVHLNGGVSALTAAVFLGPRSGRFTQPEKFTMSSPVISLTGTFMLTWAWMGFNAGATYGISGHKWEIAVIASVNTLHGGAAGGMAGLVISMWINRGAIKIDQVIASILAGLVSITGICNAISPVESVVIGFTGGVISLGALHLLERLRVDDPVGAVAVHMFAGIWGTIAVGIFAKDNIQGDLQGRNGICHGGDHRLLLANLIAIVVVSCWACVSTLLILALINVTIGVRSTEDSEFMGADFIEHKHGVAPDLLTLSSSELQQIVRQILNSKERKKLKLRRRRGKATSSVSTVREHCTVDRQINVNNSYVLDVLEIMKRLGPHMTDGYYRPSDLRRAVKEAQRQPQAVATQENPYVETASHQSVC